LPIKQTDIKDSLRQVHAKEINTVTLGQQYAVETLTSASALLSKRCSFQHTWAVWILWTSTAER